VESFKQSSALEKGLRKKTHTTTKGEKKREGSKFLPQKEDADEEKKKNYIVAMRRFIRMGKKKVAVSYCRRGNSKTKQLRFRANIAPKNVIDGSTCLRAIGEKNDGSRKHRGDPKARDPKKMQGRDLTTNTDEEKEGKEGKFLGKGKKGGDFGKPSA